MAYVRHPNKFKPLLLDEARNAHKSGTHVFGQALEFGVNCFIQSFDNPSGSHYYTKKDISTDPSQIRSHSLAGEQGLQPGAKSTVAVGAPLPRAVRV